MKRILLMTGLFLVPLISQAVLIEDENGWWIEKDFILPSGIIYRALELIQPKQEPNDIEENIRYWAKKMKLNPDFMVAIAYCESRLNPTARGDWRSETGEFLANGIFQFWRGTFEAFKKESGMVELNYWLWRDQVKLAVWGFVNGKESHWSNCLKAVKQNYSLFASR